MIECEAKDAVLALDFLSSILFLQRFLNLLPPLKDHIPHPTVLASVIDST